MLKGSKTLLTQRSSGIFQPTLLGALILITLLQGVFSWYVRRSREQDLPSTYSLTHLHFDPYAVGLVVQDMVIPIALVFLASNIAVFRRVANGVARKRDSWLLFILFTAVQSLFYVYGYALNALDIPQVTRGFIVVMMAGLLGGPLVGAGLGFVTWLLMGLRSLLFWPPETFNAESIFFWYFLSHQEGNAVLWLGLASGLIAGLLGRYRFFPSVAFVLGIFLELFSRYFSALTMSEPGYWIEPLVINLLSSGLVLAIFALMVSSVQVSAMRQQTEAAQLAIAQAELRALRAQINPHFLFNSLNTIRYFVRTSPDKARELLLDLSEVFQRALKSGDFVPLRDEISYVKAYLALEEARLGERLDVQWTLSDEMLLSTPVPTLILQPLVENAVIHGVAHKPEGGTLSIIIETWDGDLVMQVRDDGVGFDSAQLKATLGTSPFNPHLAGNPETHSTAIGLRNIHGRLTMIYGPSQGLSIESEPGRGTRVQLRLPLNALREKAVPQIESTPQPSLPSLPLNPPALEPETS